MRSSRGLWVGVVYYQLDYADGRNERRLFRDQLVPVYALAPRDDNRPWAEDQPAPPGTGPPPRYATRARQWRGRLRRYPEQVSAISFSARAADSRVASIHPTT